MRIGLFTDTYPPYINGVSTSVFSLKQALEKAGHQVFLVTVNPDNMKYKYEENGKIIKLPGVPVRIYDYRLTGIYPIRVINKIKKWKLDVIHSHTEFGVGTFARLIAKQLNIPLVHTYHTMYEDYVHYITKGYFKKSSKKLVEYLTKFYCDTTANELIVPTKKTWDLFKEKYKMNKNIYIIPSGMNLERFYKEKINAEELKTIRKKINVNKSDFILLFVGRIGKEKNIEFLLDCHKDLKKTIHNLKLIIVGDGPEKEEIENKVKKDKLDGVIFTGMVPWNQIQNYYALSDIFVTASTTETQGLTVIEAMAAGTVPVCINDDSFKLTVIDDLNGRIFKNKKEYKNIITDLYLDRDKLNKLSNQASINAELHSSRHYADSVLLVYKNAINNKKNKTNFIKKLFSTNKNN
ncbi:MAG: glycosyltransferase family 4 protein [bacterium]|nr:glycosyltransferase family 4 protein [bacterium]